MAHYSIVYVFIPMKRLFYSYFIFFGAKIDIEAKFHLIVQLWCMSMVHCGSDGQGPEGSDFTGKVPPPTNAHLISSSDTHGHQTHTLKLCPSAHLETNEMLNM